MMCEECGIRPANFHITTIAGDTRTKRDLCAVCMAKYQKQLPGLDFTNLVGILTGMLGMGDEREEEEENTETPELTCEECGMTYKAFRKGGMLGCANCYKAFKTPLDMLLQRIHGNTQHAGHIPGNVRSDMAIRMSIERLRQKLSRAIAEEEYEQAAQLRDSIRALQAQLNEQGEARDIKVEPPRRITFEGGEPNA